MCWNCHFEQEDIDENHRISWGMKPQAQEGICLIYASFCLLQQKVSRDYLKGHTVWATEEEKNNVKTD